MQILVPLDGSPFAESAIEPAAALLRRAASPNTLTFVRIISPGSVAPDFTGFVPPVTESAFQAAIEGGKSYLAQVATRRPLHGIRVATVTQLGSDTAGDICQLARELAVDLIVMTSHARTGIAHFALGSVAEAVLRGTTIPTLLLHRDSTSFPSTNRDEPLTILVPLDGSPMAETVLAPVIQLAAQVRGAIRVVRVLPMHTSATPTERMLVETTQRYFAALRAKVEGAGVPMYETLAWGDPVERITAVAQQYQTDLIAMATHGRTGLTRLRDGSITLDVLHHLATPLFVMHPSAAVVTAPAPLSVIG